MSINRGARIALTVLLCLTAAANGRAAEGQLGFGVQLEGEGFFLNPVVRKIIVTEVMKHSIAEAAGLKSGDEILFIDGNAVKGQRAWELRSFMKLNPGETRTLRLRHSDGTEVDARITKPKT